MPQIIINVQDNSFELKGDIEYIINDERAYSNFESIGAILDKDNIIIPFEKSQSKDSFTVLQEQYILIKELLEKFDLDEKQTTQAEKFLYDVNQENEKFGIFSKKSKNIRNNIHDKKDFENFIEVLASNMNRKLYPQQLLSAYHLSFSQNGCNFSVPGAGKTSIVYGTYAYLKNLPNDNLKYVDRILIIGPLASFSPWKKEFKECFGEEPSVKELVGVDSIGRRNHFLSSLYTELTLISYQSMAMEVDNICAFLNSHNVMVVLDEAHKIKNVNDGKWANAVLEIAKYANSRIVLTGTPAPNGYQDLYNLYQFIWPKKDILGFPIPYMESLNTDKTPSAKKNIEELISNASPFFIRIRKSDLGLPEPKINKPIYIEMDENQEKIYNFIEKNYVDSINKNEQDSFTIKLKKAKLIRLMQCLTNPSLLQKPLDNYMIGEGLVNEINIEDREIAKAIKEYSQNYIPPKFIEAKRLISKIIKEQGATGKVIIWTIFIDNIFQLQEYLKQNNINSELLYGGTPNENEDTPKELLTREKIIDKFHEEDCPYRVIIANPFAVGESISLHKACHNAIYLERNFNAAMYMQSKDRIHRYGLKNNDIINYHFLLTKNSIDEVIHKRLIEKENRMLDIIEKEEIPLLNMNMDETTDDQNDIQSIMKYYYEKQSTRN
jgi:hypothetical protein